MENKVESQEGGSRAGGTSLSWRGPDHVRDRGEGRETIHFLKKT